MSNQDTTHQPLLNSEEENYGIAQPLPPSPFSATVLSLFHPSLVLPPLRAPVLFTVPSHATTLQQNQNKTTIDMSSTSVNAQLKSATPSLTTAVASSSNDSQRIRQLESELQRLRDDYTNQLVSHPLFPLLNTPSPFPPSQGTVPFFRRVWLRLRGPYSFFRNAQSHTHTQ